MNSISNYTNRVFNTDIMVLLDEIPKNSIDCVFSDPDYNVGIKYNENVYTKNFNEYIKWYIELAKKCLYVLKDDGNMFLINYPKQNSYLWVKFLDMACYDVQEYVWIYNTNIGHSKYRFTTAHRTILHCRKSSKNKFYKENVAVPYQNPTDRRILKNIANGSKGRMPYSWFYYDLVKNVSHEKTYHSCQIPQKLSEMLIKSCTLEGDIVLIPFGGSGAEIEVCKNLKRKFISAEIDENYYKMILERLEKGKIDDKYKLKIAQTKRLKERTMDLPFDKSKQEPLWRQPPTSETD
ncbi:MAG: site-specific DNA-methyltransferase [candidate division Zixibacteria bacterium]|nr:site-specific DNA-methyltransferase [Candidatus Tariuqbacter arcticus]